MSKQTLRKVPDEDVFRDFEGEYECLIKEDGIVITGNSRMYGYGDETLRKVIEGGYYDDECGHDYDKLEMLEKLTGKAYESRYMRGYSQGDWQEIYYPKETPEVWLEEIEDAYMGKFDEYILEEGDDFQTAFYVPHRVAWKGKKAICEYCGCNPEDTIVLIDDGYKKVYNYKELED